MPADQRIVVVDETGAGNRPQDKCDQNFGVGALIFPRAIAIGPEEFVGLLNVHRASAILRTPVAQAARPAIRGGFRGPSISGGGR